jgi:hypothetical protein
MLKTYPILNHGEMCDKITEAVLILKNKSNDPEIMKALWLLETVFSNLFDIANSENSTG